MPKLKRRHQECHGCGNAFHTYKNFDYCQDCAVNGNRYLTKSDCPECDGSGGIKFPGQPKRPCKLCYLTKNMTNKFKQTPKITAEQVEEKYWEQVDHLTQEKIYHLFTKNIPFQNIPLITESYRYEDKQPKKVGLFLHRDVDYRTLLGDIENQYSDEEGRPDPEYIAEEITLYYSRLVIKSLIENLSEYSPYDPSYFTNLTN